VKLSLLSIRTSTSLFFDGVFLWESLVEQWLVDWGSSSWDHCGWMTKCSFLMP
jgi:hypothetical protein